MSTPVSGSSGAGRSQEAVQKFVDTALREVLAAVSAKYFKAPDRLGPIANVVFNELTETAGRNASEGARRPKKADILQGAARLAAAVLLDTKGQGEIREGFHSLVRAVAGDPPQVDDEKNAKLTKRKNTKDDGTLTLAKSHILWVLLDRIGLQNPKFGTNARETLNNPRHTRLDDKAGWQGFAVDLAEAVLKDGAELAKSLVQKLVGADLSVSAPAAAAKPNGRNISVAEGPIPTGPIEAEASNTTRRVSAETSPMLTLVRNLASSTATTRAEREKRDPAAVAPELNAPEAIVRHVADALGVPDAKGINVATKIVEKAFAPYQEYENPNKFDALEAVLKALIKSSEEKVKGAEEKVRRAERTASKAPNDAKAKETLDKAHSELGILTNELTTMRARLERAQAIRFEVTEAGASESMEKAFSHLLGQGLGKLVADALELSPSERKGMDRLDTLDKIYQGLFHRRDRLDRTGMDRLHERVKERGATAAESTATKSARPFELPKSLLKIIDPKDPAGSAAGIAKAFPMLEQPEAAELKDKLVSAMTALLEKHRPETNLDLVTRIGQALVDAGVSNEAASILPLFATGVHTEAEAALRSAHEAVENGKRLIDQQKNRVAAMEGELVKKQSALKDLKDNLPEDPTRKAEAEQAIAGLQTTIGDYEAQLKKLRADVVEARKGLPTLIEAMKGAREDYLTQMDGMAVSGLESLLRALMDPKATEEFLLEQKPRLQEMGYLPKDEAGAGGNKPPKDPNDPGGPSGPNDPPPPNKPGGPDGSKLPHRAEPTPAQMRALECAQVLADPCLSIQDKVFYFMLIFAKWSDKEREDKLRELTKQEEEAAKWDAQRQDISKSQDARIEERRQVNKELDTAEARLRGLQTKVDAGELPSDSKEFKEAQEKVKNLNERSQDLTRGVEKLGDELREAANKADKAPRARELIFSEIDKITKFRDQMINMARSMIDDANRLIERIFR